MSAPHLVKKARGIYHAHWTRPDGQERYSSTRTRDLAAAQRFLARVSARQEAPAASPLVGDLWAAYFEGHVRAKSASIETARYCWQNLNVAFGALFAEDVDFKGIDAYIEARKTGAIGRTSSAPTIRRELAVLRACFNWCAKPRNGLLRLEQVPQFDLPPNGRPRDRWLRNEEIEALLKAARRPEHVSRCELFIWLGLETGARKEALLGLTWGRVDLEVGVIDFQEPGRTTTKKKRVVVPISTILRPILMRAFEDRRSEFVFGPCTPIDSAFRTAVERAGLKNVSPNTLRHTAATRMARAGVPLWKIAGVLGNSAAVVESVYAKHCPDELRSAVNAMTKGG